MDALEEDVRVDVTDLLNSLQRASEIPAKRRVTKASAIVDQLCEHAFRFGLDQDAVTSIIDIVTTRNELDQTSITNLIKHLFPNAKIPTSIVTKLISCLGQGKSKPSNATQAALIKWLAIVSGILESPTIISRLYSVLFGLLDMISLRAPLCHLLAVVTRRRHVRPFRIQYLLELSRVVGNEPPLVGLLKVYKDYYPDIIIGKTQTGRGILPPQPDADWIKRLQSIQDKAEYNGLETDFRRNGFKVFRPKGRKPRDTLLPELHTSLASETSTTLEEIESPQDFVDKIEHLELPNQIISSLRDPLLQKLLLLSPNPTAAQRLELWLSTYLEDELITTQETSASSPHFNDFLKGMLNITQAQKSIPSIFQAFLRSFLPVWDGCSNLDELYGILVYLPRQPFKDAHQNYLTWVENSLQRVINRSPQKLLVFYGHLARMWIPSDEDLNNTSVRNPLPSFKYVNELCDHVGSLVLAMLSAHPISSMLHASIISFYEILHSSAEADLGVPLLQNPIISPPAQVVNHLLFCSTLSDVSRLCAVLATCKQRFESLKSKITDFYQPEYTNRFNGHLMDICNLLWRTRALNSQDANATGCLSPISTTKALLAYVPQMDQGYSLPENFDLSHHYLICAISSTFIRFLEDSAEKKDLDFSYAHSGPATNRSLLELQKRNGLRLTWKDYRKGVLLELERKGLGGIKELMFSTMTNLREGE